ncbi:unnamed protein product [Phyllotreta striolata]|uniref:Uncharacterized protein n=1 Tax=Phyllotreta striolata TaxID=444603 RepID=A0A9N9XP69_PHYSR|nr:unnamed protein product [Phyllotreta striolata]
MEKVEEKRSPLEKSNVFSLLTFGYVLGLLRKGWKRDLDEEDLYALPKKCKSKYYGYQAIQQWKKTPTPFKFLLHKLGKVYLMFCFAHLTWTEFRSFLRPYGISRLITYFDKNQTTITETEAYYCASIVIFTKFFQFFFISHMLVLELKFLIQLRVSLQTLLYDKILRFSSTSLANSNSGNLITILTKDIHCIESNLWIFKDFAIFTVQSVTIFYLIWSKVGLAAFSAVVVYCIALPVQGYLCTRIAKLKLKVCKNSDDRLQLTQEVLSAIRVVKMYTWEKFYIRKITDSRRKEVAALLKMLLLHFVLVVIGLFVSGVTFLVLILTYIWLGNDTNTELIYYVLSLFGELTMAMGIMIPMNMSRTAEFAASLKRIGRVLAADELAKVKNIYSEAGIDVSNVAVRIEDKTILEEVSMKIARPGLHVVTGSVGTGKSSIFHVLIGLTNYQEGHCKIGGSISYAAQEPWLFPSSIKNNILFGEKFNKERYERVLKVCALDYDLSYLQNGDETLVAEGGLNLSKGQQARINLARCVYKQSDIYLLDDPLTALDGSVQDYIFNECLLKLLRGKIVVLVSQNDKHLKEADDVFTLKAGKLVCDDRSKLKSEDGDKRDDSIGNNVEKSVSIEKEILEKAALVANEKRYTNENLFRETQQTGTVELDVYKSYIKFGGGYLFLAGILLLNGTSQGTHILNEKLFAKWVDVQNINITSENGSLKMTYLNYYSISLIGSSIVTFITLYTLLRFARNASLAVHTAMISRIITAMMTFFDSHYLGNVVNRFSYDLNIVDEKLPLIFLHLFRAIFGCLGIIVIIITVNWIFVFPSAIFLTLILLLRFFYINTGRNLKRKEAITRSPLVAHLNCTVDGLSTIRAFDAEKRMADEFYRHQDLYSSAIFTMRVTQAAFTFYMGALSATFTTLIIAKYLFFKEETTAGNVGLVLTNILRISDLISWGVNEWIELETNMTSVERCLEYTKVNQELQTGNKSKDWPKEGEIAFKQVQLKYGSDDVSILKNINFVVEPKQHVGLVGRTGAGKSSIISTLFRLYDFEGTIEIDGEDTKTISLDYLRNNIVVIPQDPVLFTGTLRENLDPDRRHSDEEIWSILKKLLIEGSVKSLDAPVPSFSAGEKQLLCMGRAALRKCKIVVLDEITANMDAENDELIHSLVEQVFDGCTILMVAHRLNFILGCDRVIVMDKGEIVEFDEPKRLLQDGSSVFSRICDKAKS